MMLRSGHTVIRVTAAMAAISSAATTSTPPRRALGWGSSLDPMAKPTTRC
jgi:hypothetical protein